MGFREVRPGVYEPDEEDMKFLKEKQAKQARKASKKKSRSRYSYSPKRRGGGRSFLYDNFFEGFNETEKVENLAKTQDIEFVKKEEKVTVTFPKEIKFDEK